MTPGPISAQAEQYLTTEVTKVPVGRRGQVSGTVTNQGVYAGVGVRWKQAGTASAFVAKDKTSGWTYGLRAGWSW
ncbi:MAG: hypothetical protein NUW22_12510 [Acidobacteria bacterium]|nr:hypothetical protein [Acidobacteriota bacterium]